MQDSDNNYSLRIYPPEEDNVLIHPIAKQSRTDFVIFLYGIYVRSSGKSLTDRNYWQIIGICLFL